MSHTTTLHVVPGNVLTVTAGALASGSVTRLSDVVGGEPSSPVALGASSSLVLGPFSKPRRYAINSAAGTLTYSMVLLDLPAAAVADAAAATAVAFPAGGAGAAAGGWDTAVNRDLAIARFTALLADVAALRTAVNTLLARQRGSGDILT